MAWHVASNSRWLLRDPNSTPGMAPRCAQQLALPGAGAASSTRLPSDGTGGAQPSGCTSSASCTHLPLPLHATPFPQQVHLNRAGVWGVALLRVLASGEWSIAAAICVVLLLPAILLSLPLRLYMRCEELGVRLLVDANALPCCACCWHSAARMLRAVQLLSPHHPALVAAHPALQAAPAPQGF